MLNRCFEEYKNNIKVCLLFALLLLFVPLFLIPFFGTGTALSSGTIFLEYRLSSSTPLLVLLAILFLALYSFFVSLVVFAVRRDLSKVKVEFYLDEMVKKFAVRIFIFYTILMVIIFSLSTIASALGMQTMLAFLAIAFIISLAFMFVPQAIVVDELSLAAAMRESMSFIRRNAKETLAVLMLGCALLLIVGVLEYVLDLFFMEFFAGEFVALLLTLIFIVPFVEITKTYFYMLKFNLIRKSELVK